MKKGDLVFRKSWGSYGDQYGIIITRRSSDSFDVMFDDGLSKGIWVYELAVVSEGR